MEIRVAAIAHPEFSPLDLVADEEIFHNGEDFVSSEEIKPAPPPFERQEAIAFAVYMDEKICIFLPDSFRTEVFKVLNEPRPIKSTIAEVG